MQLVQVEAVSEHVAHGESHSVQLFVVVFVQPPGHCSRQVLSKKI